VSISPSDEIREFFDWLDKQSVSLRQEAIREMRSWLDLQEATLSEAKSKEAVQDPSDGLPGKYGMIGDSDSMKEVFSVLGKIIQTDVPVLVLGESGVGKELIARALHHYGPRRKAKLLAVNCAAISPNLLESELFGHKKGSFTGAHKDRKGYAEEADGGTLFLDEIGEMAPDLQAKLLRFLQDGEIRPVGGNEICKVDVRVVAATNRDLEEQVRKGSFREDLYYRLAVISLKVPALRERKEDIGLIARFLMARNALEGLPSAEISDEFIAELQSRDWPGNIRELQNELTRAAAFSKGKSISGDS
jgi:DNA-binding NtrC family response regulator